MCGWGNWIGETWSATMGKLCKLLSKLKYQTAPERAKSSPKSRCDSTPKSTIFFLLLVYHWLAYLNPTQIQVHVAGLVRIKESMYFAIHHGIQFTVLNMYVEKAYALVSTGIEDKRKISPSVPWGKKLFPFLKAVI